MSWQHENINLPIEFLMGQIYIQATNSYIKRFTNMNNKNCNQRAHTVLLTIFTHKKHPKTFLPYYRATYRNTNHLRIVFSIRVSPNWEGAGAFRWPWDCYPRYRGPFSIEPFGKTKREERAIILVSRWILTTNKT